MEADRDGDGERPISYPSHKEQEANPHWAGSERVSDHLNILLVLPGLPPHGRLLCQVPRKNSHKVFRSSTVMIMSFRPQRIIPLQTAPNISVHAVQMGKLRLRERK